MTYETQFLLSQASIYSDKSNYSLTVAYLTTAEMHALTTRVSSRFESWQATQGVRFSAGQVHVFMNVFMGDDTINIQVENDKGKI